MSATSRSKYVILKGTWIFHPLRGIQNLYADNIATMVIVKDNARLILITFLNWSVSELDTQDIYLWVIGYFHHFLQYFSILLVR